MNPGASFVGELLDLSSFCHFVQGLGSLFILPTGWICAEKVLGLSTVAFRRFFLPCTEDALQVPKSKSGMFCAALARSIIKSRLDQGWSIGDVSKATANTGPTELEESQPKATANTGPTELEESQPPSLGLGE